MSNLDQIIDYTKLFQDVELATAIGQLKKDPSQLQQFLQDQQGKVFGDIVKQKDSTFQKVYGDLNRASEAQESILMLDKRNKELAQIQQQIYDNQKNSAEAITSDKNLAGRKHEMNEWSVNNKKETLFIMTMLFIALSALTLITVLWRMGLMSSALWGGLAAPIIIIFTLVLINRTQYTDIFSQYAQMNKFQVFNITDLNKPKEISDLNKESTYSLLFDITYVQISKVTIDDINQYYLKFFHHP
jgi:hypothetical protein